MCCSSGSEAEKKEEEEGAPEEETEKFFSTVRPEEVPEVPENRFLSRDGPKKDDDGRSVEQHFITHTNRLGFVLLIIVTWLTPRN